MDADSSGRMLIHIANATAQNTSVDQNLIFYLVALFILILINAAFSAAEIAIITVNDNKVRALADDGDKTSIRIVKFLDKPSQFLATIQVGITFAGYFASALAAMNFAQPLAKVLDPAGKYPFILGISVVIITLILAYVSLVFGELVPKRVAMKNPYSVIKYTLWILIFLGSAIKPLVYFLTFSTNLVLRIIGINPDDHEKTVTEEEIRMMINVGRETGSIHDSEKEMIENIFEFNDTQVSEIMTHRTDLVSLNCDAPFDEVLQIAVSEKFTRIPVYRDSIDNIIGILHIKDLLVIAVEGLNQPFNLENIIRAPLFVPETKTIDEVFREMQTEHAQIAVVIDEYGGTAGIITIEDLLEEIVGSMQDEYDEEEEEIVREDENTIVAEGKTGLDEIAEELKIKFPEDGDYDTIAGMFIDILGRIPDEDEKPEVTYENITMKVLEMSDKRIVKIRITALMPDNNDEKDDDNDDKSDKNDKKTSTKGKDKNGEKSENNFPGKEYEKYEIKKMELLK